MKRLATTLLALVLTLATPGSISAQGRPDPVAMMAAQKKAIQSLAFMDGVWRGPAWTLLPSGEKHFLTQTERIGPFLDGTVRVIEGRGYEADGKLSFNAFGTISCNPATGGFTLHSYAMGRVGDYALTPGVDGFVWEIPAGPMILRYTATIREGAWKEVGDRIAPGKEPVRFFEMSLKRVGDTDWPSAGAVSPK